MKKHKLPAVHGNEVNVTPLIDVVMCLIIFFMLVARIGVATGASPMPLPEIILGKKIEDLGQSMVINVFDRRFERDSSGVRVLVNGKPVRLPQQPQEHLPMVSALLSENDTQPKLINLVHPVTERLELTEALKAAVARNKEFSVTIRAEKDLEFGLLQQVLEKVANAGVRNVNYAAKPKTS